MKVMTILGTRPEIIRLSLVIARLDELATRHVLVHTGQNSDQRLSGIFLQELSVRPRTITCTCHPTRSGNRLGK